ncbi:uncharacterized protein AB675_3162 [Cyphellophora attinorum]|uniref:DUF4048 domain-containing protein n=1 Tax=Cyphellophora attinorum TaxID=1664694 RepID=A0A0N1H1J9_9EURO|nr:uncharacterized protein AB675_3162 [Phialophora attinorum]KPI38013.1 hypothetical protein AB675_3162 [Phialophora attinorum]
MKAVSFHTSNTTATPVLFANPTTTSSGTDFLTLIASQERKVLEIREELDKAEQELTLLKKQWATYEGRKKKEEVIRVRRGVPVALGDVPHIKQVEDLDIQEEERRRRRVLVELSGNAAGSGSPAIGGGGVARKGSQSQRKVFEGRHTRTLSLLSPTAVRRRSDEEDFAGSIDSELQEGQASTEEHNAQAGAQPGTSTTTLETSHQLSRLPTLDGFVSPDAISATSATTPTFGKTYKDLVAAQQRRSLPPATVDMMKQGRAVVEGVRDGLWTFFEDIRQATVGDEAVYGPTSAEQQARLEGRWVAKKNGRNNRFAGSASPDRKKVSMASTTGGKDSTGKPHDSSKKEDSFWREFGLDTPGRAPQDAATSRAVTRTNDASKPPRKTSGSAADVNNTIKGHRAHTPNDSSGSSSTPDLLSDSPGATSEAASKEEDDLDEGDIEHWDNWDASSPLVRRQDSVVEETAVKAAVVDGEDLPWPELEKPKDTPTKLARTGSDFIREMEA